MSSFSGRAEELNNVLIDNFEGFQFFTCFFLSHAHTDHMNGIKELLKYLESKRDQYLYCSPITHLILLNTYPEMKSKNVIKELTSPEVIFVPENDSSASYNLTVTPIPAGHCPGSIMFLFEAGRKRILYTGDFRIKKNDISNFKHLHTKNQVKLIDKIYLDSTFLNKNYWDFPQRSEIIDELVTEIKEWLSKGSEYQVVLLTSANYGYEFVFVELARKLKCKVHVNDKFYQTFWNVPEIGFELTDNCHSTNLHAFYKKAVICCPDNEYCLSIKFSAAQFRFCEEDVKKATKRGVNKKSNKISVCYSNHCSCSELVDFLNYLKPKSVEICSVAMDSTQEDTEAYLSQIMSAWSDEEEISESDKCSLSLEKNYKFRVKLPNREDVVNSPERKKRLLYEDNSKKDEDSAVKIG